jgi:hypothetical protein
MSVKLQLLILPSRQQHQRTRHIYADVVAFEQLIKFWILGSRIENDALGMRLHDIIVVFALVARIEVERNGIYIGTESSWCGFLYRQLRRCVALWQAPDAHD